MKLLASAFLVGAMVAGASAAGFQNGSFEIGPDAGGYLTLGAGDTSITGWTVSANTIDYIGSYWVASDGDRSVDLDGGGGFGAIEQTFDTVAGKTYVVTFDISGNSDGPPVIKSADVSVDGYLSTYTFDSTASTHSSMGWLTQSFSFVADDTSATLKFASLDPNAYGAAIDNVKVEAVPEPATMAVLGFGALGLLKRRRKA